jgi:uncharacterized protein YuzE
MKISYDPEVDVLSVLLNNNPIEDDIIRLEDSYGRMNDTVS